MVRYTSVTVNNVTFIMYIVYLLNANISMTYFVEHLV